MDTATFHSPLAHFDATALLDGLAVPLVIVDSGCCVTYANEAARGLVRADLSALRGTPFDHAFVGSESLRAELKSMLADGADPQPSSRRRIAVRELADPRRELVIRAFRFVDELTGPHLLLQLVRGRRRRRAPVLSLVPGYDSLPVPAAAVAAAGAGAVATQLECA